MAVQDEYKHDPRLDKLTPGQYRIWYDGQNIMIPKGQSTTKPLQPELVNANTRVYGEINQSFFTPPCVDFTNTNVDIERFDRYWLQTWRPGDNLPSNPSIDWHDDLHLQAIKIRYNVSFTVASLGITGRSGGIVWLDFNGIGTNGGKNWVSQVLHFDDYNLQHLRGDFIIVTNPTAGQASIGADYTTAQFLQPVNLPINIIINDVIIVNGISQMDVILKNDPFLVTLKEFEFSIIGGE